MVKVLNREGIQRMVGRTTGSGGSGGSSSGGGGISIAQVDAAYVSKDFFNQLFTVHGKRTYTDPETQEEVTEDVIISPNQIAEGEYSLSNVEVSVGLWTNSFLSALGLNSGGGGGGVSSLTDLLDVQISSPSNGQALVYDTSLSPAKWVNKTIFESMTYGSNVLSLTISGVTRNVTIQAGTSSVDWDNITNKPNTATRWPTFAEVTSKPTTLGGYGITDAYISNGTIYLGSNSITPITSLYGYATQEWVSQQGYLTSSAISDMATKTWVGQQGFLKASDLNGYATQQWVQQQNYLTSHQSVDGTFWGQSWNNHGALSGSIDAGSYGGVFSGFHAIELNNHGTLSGYGGYIDFHFNGSSSDYTSRIIEDASGRLFFDTSVGVRIGSVVLSWDSGNNALKIQNIDGTAANFYATGGVSALGMSAGVSQVDAMTFNYVTINNNLEFGAASRITHAVTNDDRTLYIGNSDNSGWVALQDVCSQSGVSYWKIMANGEALFAEKVQSPKFYLDTTRYIYVNGGTLYYYNGSTSRQIAFS